MPTAAWMEKKRRGPNQYEQDFPRELKVSTSFAGKLVCFWCGRVGNKATMERFNQPNGYGYPYRCRDREDCRRVRLGKG